MATYNTPLITTQGLSLLKAEIAGNDSVTFTKIVFSSDDYSQTADISVQALTGLSSLDLTAPARSFTDVNGNLKIRAVGNNQNTTSAFYIKTYGLYGKNNAGNELLIAVATTQNANFVPAYNGKQTNQIAYTFNIAISSTNNITLSSSTDVSVTQADLAGINSAVNSNTTSLAAQQGSYAGSLSSALSSNVSSVQSAIGSNASNIASNSTNISSLQSSVSTNSSAIASNSGAISSLQSSVATNSSAISTLQSSVANSSQYMGMYKGKDLGNTNELNSLLPSMKDGYYELSTPNSDFAMYGMLQVQTTSDYRYIIVFDLLHSRISFNKYVIGVGVTEWKILPSTGDVNSIVNNQISSVQNSTLQFKGSIPGNSLTILTAPGIYDLGGNTFTDWVNNSQIWGQLTVVVTGGVRNLTVRNNFGNMWIQSVNSWGNSGWKQIA